MIVSIYLRFDRIEEALNALCFEALMQYMFCCLGTGVRKGRREARLLRPPPPQARPLRGGERLLQQEECMEAAAASY